MEGDIHDERKGQLNQWMAVGLLANIRALYSFPYSCFFSQTLCRTSSSLRFPKWFQDLQSMPQWSDPLGFPQLDHGFNDTHWQVSRPWRARQQYLPCILPADAARLSWRLYAPDQKWSRSCYSFV